MRDRTFAQLERALRDAGVASRHIRRMTTELHDHLDDLRAEAVARGCDPFEAHASAIKRLGDQCLLAQEVIARPEFRSWDLRHPRIARVCYPVAYALLLPVAPVIVRWGTAMMLSAAITATMLLAMQLSISSG